MTDKLGARISTTTLNGAFEGTARAHQQSLTAVPIVILAAIGAIESVSR